MRRSRQAFLLLVLLVSVVEMLSGCSFGGRPQSTQLYVLTPILEEEAAAGQTALGVAVGVGPIVLPEYVDRPQIVTGNSGPELHRAASARWAEPLSENFTRVLAENLSLLLATDRVAVFPWKGPLPMEYQVIVHVTRFLGEAGGEASLIALWSIVGNNGKDVLASKKSSFTEPTEAHDYAALAAAMSRTVAALSRDIATTITILSQQASNR